VNARHWLAQAERADAAIYAAVARTDSPTIDRAMYLVSHAANYSRLWIAAAALLAATGGRDGRRAAADGLASVAVTAVVVNAVVKPLARRRRPDRGPLLPRHVRMPRSRSFPSGHAASASAFATGVGAVQPRAAVRLHALAALVAYSRVHTGVHYPADVVVGSLLGMSVARLTTRAPRSHRRRT
jgi:membrane-associated phospholipid phosphatase